MTSESSNTETDRQRQLTRGNQLLALFLAVAFVGSLILLFEGSFVSDAFAGWAVFVIIPASLGGLLSMAIDPKGQFSPLGCFVWPTLIVIALVLLAWAFLGEGAICLAMLLPIWIAAAVGGFLIQRWSAYRRIAAESNGGTRLQAVAWFAFPLVLIWAETVSPPQWEEHSVTRSVEIAASPAEVWPLLVSIPNIAPGEGRATFAHDLFGIPRPAEAVLETRDGALIRKARWGENIRFEEQITAIAPGERIDWRFAFPDSSVAEYTDPHIEPDGAVLRIENGGYRIESLASGRVRLTLETRYSMRSRMAWYAALWGELFLGDISANVLTLVKDRAEKTAI